MRHFVLLFQLMCAALWTSPAMAHEQGWLKDFSRIPVMEEGRIKPMDTYARFVLLQFSGRDHYENMPASQWLADLLFRPESVGDDKVFLINNPDIPTALSIDINPRRRYSFNQLHAHAVKLAELAQGASAIAEKQRSLVEKEIIRVFENLEFYINLSASFRFVDRDKDFAVSSAPTARALGLRINQDGYSFIDMALRAEDMRRAIVSLETKPQTQWTTSDREIMGLAGNLFSWSGSFNDLPLHVIPSTRQEVFLTPWEALTQEFMEPVVRQQVLDLAAAATAYRHQRMDATDLALKRFLTSVSSHVYPSARRSLKYIGLELAYQRVKPFDWALTLFLIALALIFVSLFGEWSWMDPILWSLMGAAAFLNFSGVLIRCIILSRPPVSSLYETFIFVSLIAVICSLVIEFVQHNRLGFLTGAISSSALLMIASKYSAEGDTLKMLIAVLNSNFWLGTHVVTITTGYATTCVAGVLGHVWLVQKVLGQKEKVLQATMNTMVAVMGVALILTFFGTNLGGIWADQSWGRFWGWDPKENGALMIVLWLIFLFHAKAAKILDDTGLAVGNVFSLMVVMWAWFGVNLLSIGLHSYGFTSGVAGNLCIYGACEVVFMLILFVLIKSRRRTNIR